jgi:hypothetical protein
MGQPIPLLLLVSSSAPTSNGSPQPSQPGSPTAGGRVAWVRHCAAADAWEAEQRAIRARSDKQRSWVLAADPRGTYGTEGNRIAVAGV